MSRVRRAPRCSARPRLTRGAPGSRTWYGLRLQTAQGTFGVKVSFTLKQGAAGLSVADVEVSTLDAPWSRAAENPCRYVVLRSSLKTNVARATGRTGTALTDSDVVQFTWKQFEDLGRVSGYALATDSLTHEQSVQMVEQHLWAGDFCLR